MIPIESRKKNFCDLILTLKIRVLHVLYVQETVRRPRLWVSHIVVDEVVLLLKE